MQDAYLDRVFLRDRRQAETGGYGARGEDICYCLKITPHSKYSHCDVAPQQRKQWACHLKIGGRWKEFFDVLQGFTPYLRCSAA
jgi:hypothetical protein